MKHIMISAMGSGSGKTVLTCGLLRALQRRGLKPVGVKCGPDYIDPMFHRRVLGTPGRNLDLFLQGAEGVRRCFNSLCGDIALLEGAMGLFDGLAGTDEASAYHVARLTGTPVVLVVRPKGVGLTLAAQIRGMMAFRSPNCIAALLLNGCSTSLFNYLKPLLERECGIPVLGYLPELPEAVLESRHLGLVTAGEITDLERRMDIIAAQLEQYVDLERLLSLCAETETPVISSWTVEQIPVPRCRIAVARDEAFCFYYEDNLRLLEEAGAELIYFSPLWDEALPDCDGIYLGGGYPELYAEQLSKNTAVKDAICTAAEAGMPLVAECGGFLYLQKSLAGHPMTDVLDGEGLDTGRLQRFGYVELTAAKDSLLFRASERVPAHEFHYWDCTENGSDLTASKPQNGKSWSCGVCTPTMYAAFPHLHFGGDFPFAARFTAAAAAYRHAGGRTAAE